MSGERDPWSSLQTPEEIQRAIERLGAYTAARSEVAARKRFLDALELGPGHRVLDVGAGTGEITFDIAQRVGRGGRVVALDPSAELLARLTASASGLEAAAPIQTCVADARAMPLDAASFDRALCHWVLLHVEHPERVVGEMARVVRPDGLLMCVEVDWDTAIVHPGDKDVTRRIFHASCDRHLDGWAGRRLVPWLRAAGLADVRCLPIVDIDDGADGPMWQRFLQERAQLALARHAVTEAEAKTWAGAIADAYAAGSAFFSVTQFAVTGRVR